MVFQIGLRFHPSYGEGREGLVLELRYFFSLLSFSSQTKKGEPEIGVAQLEATRSMKPAWLIQQGLNLKGMGPRFFSSVRSTRIGL